MGEISGVTGAGTVLVSAVLPALRLPVCSPGTAESVRWGQLYGSARSLAVSQAIRQHPGSVCVVTGSALAADTLERELGFFAPEQRPRRFCDYETLPYDAYSPPQELLAERLSALYRLTTGSREILIVNAQALLTRLPPSDFVTSRSVILKVGDRLDAQALRERLVNQGYLRVEQVLDPGDFAVRGSLIDVYPTGSEYPVRIDLFDDEIENLRIFDAHTQLSTDQVRDIRILPAKEFPFDAEAIQGFRKRFRDRVPGEPARASIYRDISDAQLPAGIEYYLPLFFDATVSLLDYLPEDTLVVLVDDAIEGLQSGWALIREREEQLRGDPERPILDADVAFWRPHDIQTRIGRFPQLELASRELQGDASDGDYNAGTRHPLDPAKAQDPDPISRWLSPDAGFKTLIATSSTGRREVVRDLLGGRGLKPSPIGNWQEFLDTQAALSLGVGDLDSGLVLPNRSIRVVTAEQLGLDRPRQRSRRRRPARDPEAIVRELTDLRVGAPVVHEEYGIGRYRGLKNLEVDGVITEFLLLEYTDSDKLYVPVHSLHLISRYTGAAAEQAPLHRLGSDQWLKARRKAAQQARDTAVELLELYARRAARKGIAMTLTDDMYQRFTLEFPFRETDDQLKAIDDVLQDLLTDKPMDRVICGDVGFGKTEVALRAAFVAVQAGYQVALLAPTTLLATQHNRTFADRFGSWPVRVELLSRFRSARDVRDVTGGMSEGTVDIVVGTHRLLSGDIEFKRLGLVIVDEEHRFGVRQKERLKRLRAEVDLLTLTATPIPRTLNMALGGLRDLSLIATPPDARLSVKTFVGQWNRQSIREAVLRELRRGGQVYFVHNQVKNIEAMAADLERLVPEAAIRVAHGQMPERTLEQVMLDFYHRRFNVLVCSTIIESGIDIPTANTIVINRADRLGLAQLHQLRGRVGRSHHQAYAYLIAPPARALTADAAKRLEAIEALEELGSGFTLATHDLEIRGAGELLGEDQSGQIQAIGFALYNELLGRAVASLRDGLEPNLEDSLTHGAEVEIGLPALIPEDYMPDVHMRLVQYKRIASADSEKALRELQVEFINRFGLLPAPARALFELARLKLMAQSLGIEKIRAGEAGGVLQFAEDASVDPIHLVNLVADESGAYRLDGPFKLRFTWTLHSDPERTDAIGALLARLGAPGEVSAAA